MSLRIFPWDAIQQAGGLIGSLVSSLQFPNRFLEWGLLWLLVAQGCLMEVLLEKRYMAICYLAGLLTVGSMLTSFLYTQDLDLSRSVMTDMVGIEGGGRGYVAGAEYMIEGSVSEQLHYERFSASEAVILSGKTTGALSASAFVQNAGSETAWVEFPLLLYKGYRAYDDNGRDFSLGYGEQNVIRVQVPGQYEGRIRVAFQSPVSWRIAEGISLLGLIILIFVVSKQKKDQKPKTAEIRAQESAVFSPKEPETALGILSPFLILLTLILLLLPLSTGYLTWNPRVIPVLQEIEGEKAGLWLAPAALLHRMGITASMAYLITAAVWTAVGTFLLFRGAKRAFAGSAYETFAARVGAAVYLLSPVSVYLLYTRADVDVWLFITLLPAGILFLRELILKRGVLPLVFAGISFGIAALGMPGMISKMADSDIRFLPAKPLLLFQMFVHEGGANLAYYLAHPIQLSPVLILLAVCMVLRPVRSRKSLAVLMVSVLLYALAMLPVPRESMITAPLDLLCIANGFLVLAFVLFFGETPEKEKMQRYWWLFGVTAAVAFCAAVFQLNEIVLNNAPIGF